MSMSQKILVCIVLILISILNTYAQGVLIRYDDKNHLKWSDFHGNVDSTSSFSAYSQVYLGYELKPFEDGYILSTDAFFSSDSSWVRHKTRHGLEHENYHFKLTEIVRRRMLKELFSIQFYVTNIHEIVDDRLDNYVLLHNQDQDYYDSETDFGRNRKRQKEIENTIDSLLVELNEYRFQYLVLFVSNDVRVKERKLTNDISALTSD